MGTFFLAMGVIPSSWLITLIHNPSVLFWLAPAVFLAGSILDNLSTYAVLRKIGLEKFYEIEQNDFVVELVKRHGPKKGLIHSLFHYKTLIATFIFALIAGLLIYLLVSSSGKPLHIAFLPLFGLLVVGFLRLLEAIKNALFIFTVSRPS